MINLEKIPDALKSLPQWVLWKFVERDGEETKVPFSTNCKPAKANDPTTWCSFDDAATMFESGGWDGIGFEFSADDEFCGIDLDGCRDPETGESEQWAKDIVATFSTYAEISPSGSGVKLFAIGKLAGGGRKRELPGARQVCDKRPAVEVYDRGRYFAVTGQRIEGATEPTQCQFEIDRMIEQYWPVPVAAPRDFNSADAVVGRARKYLTKLPAAISGQSGHNATFRAACILVLGFALDRQEAMGVLAEWNQACQPPWSERDLAHKIDGAFQQPGDRGYLRNARPESWHAIQIPNYTAPVAKHEPKLTTLAESAGKYLEVIRSGKETLIELGLPDLDYAIGGGVEPGEMVILAARPSHGKSAVALQCIHNWTHAGIKTLLISEEMSGIALGKRTLQYLSETPQEHWRTSVDDVEASLRWYTESHADCIVAESCRTAEVAAALIERAVDEYGIRCAVIDYAGLLQSPGKSRYEQMTNTSITLRQVATKTKVVLLLQCQLNREIEKRTKFVPQPSDLRDTGQLEQDADVVIFCVWPHRLNASHDPHDYQFFVTKNRNRPINQYAVGCRFSPPRQSFEQERPTNYDEAFDAFNDH